MKEELKSNYRYVFIPINALSELRQCSGNVVIKCEDVLFHPHPELLKAYIPAEDLILKHGDERWKHIADIKLKE